MRWGRAATVILVALATPTLADICDDLTALRADPSATAPLIAAADCATVLTLGEGRSLNCNWAHPFRSTSASDQFTALVASVSACLGASAEMPRDLIVNHPDSYDLRQFTDAQGTVAISLKDKGALQQPLVFMRFSPPS